MSAPINAAPQVPAPPLKVNLHTHTLLCDGKNTAEEMVVSAIQAGFDVLGFSGHSYTSFDESYCMSREDVAKYMTAVRDLAEKYRDQITVLCGIEQDYYGDDRPQVPEVFDYAIGSVHAFFKAAGDGCNAVYDGSPALPDGGKVAAAAAAGTSMDAPALPDGIIRGALDGEDGFYIYVDYSREAMEWAIGQLYGGDALALAEDYFEAVSHVFEKTGCQIIGHFDLLTKFDEQGEPLFDTSHPRYQAAADKALAALLPSGAVFEINTGAMSKGYRTSPYPSPAILKKIREGGGRITISSDCHAAGKLDWGFPEAIRLARGCGFSSFWVMDRSGLWVEQPLD